MENDRSEGIPADSIEVAIITALAFEGNAVDLFFDKRCRTSELPYLHNLPEFANSITVGNIRNHRIVLARTGEAGKAKASATAALVKAVFKQIKLVLVVGILAACLEFKETIKLGDVIISTGIVIYDSGTQEGDNYRQKGDGKKTDIAPFLDKLTGVWYRSELSKAAHGHLHEKLAKPPSDLEPPLKIPEKDPQMKPKVHFGYVGSGDVVIKDENFGKSIFSRNRKTIKGFEMEACGVEDSFPQKVVVIKGVSDYADLNKNDDIQQYAAYAATGYAIAFLDMRDSKTTHSQIVASEAKAFASERLEKAKNIILHGHRREPSATSSGGVLPPPKITPIPGSSPFPYHPTGDGIEGNAGKASKSPLPSISRVDTLGQNFEDLEEPMKSPTENSPTIFTTPSFIEPHRDSIHPPSPEITPDKSKKVPLVTEEEIKTRSKQTELMFMACKQRNVNEVRRLLETNVVDVTATDSTGKGMLHLVIGKTKIDHDPTKMNNVAQIVQLLCDYHANLDIATKDKDGWAPIHFCAKSMNVQAANVLIQRNAKVNSLDGSKRTALDILVDDRFPNKIFADKLISWGGKLGPDSWPPLKGANDEQKVVRRAARNAGRV